MFSCGAAVVPVVFSVGVRVGNSCAQSNFARWDKRTCVLPKVIPSIQKIPSYQK